MCQGCLRWFEMVFTVYMVCLVRKLLSVLLQVYPGVEEATIKGNTWLGDMFRSMGGKYVQLYNSRS